MQKAFKLHGPALALSLVATSALTTPAFAQAQAGANTDANDMAIREIIVTAQKRQESLQRSSLAVVAVTPEEIARSGVAQVSDLSRVVPGVQIGNGGASAQIFVRGVGDFSTNQNSNPGVAFNVDGVNVARPQGIGPTFFDVQRLEVLKGPQGTLYGRNASGGAINLITVKPSFDGVSGYVTLEGGNHANKHGTAALNVPLSETFAIRVAGDVIDRDGYLSDGTSDDRHEAGRVHLLWKPDSRLSWLATVDFAKIHGRGAGYVENPGPDGKFIGSTDPRSVAYLATQLPLGAGVAYGIPGGGKGLNGANTGSPPYLDNWSFNASSQIDYDMDWATLTVQPAYRYFRDRERNYPGFMNQAEFESKQFSTEARLGHDGSRAKWAVGVYYFNETIAGTVHVDFGLPQVTNVSYPESKTRSYAAFANINYSLTDAFRVLGGIRYTSDKRSLAGALSNSFFGGPPTPYIPFSGQKTFKATNWKAGAEYDLSPSNMVFATASTGYKAGGFNQEPAPNVYDPERVTAYELGMRNRFLDGRVQLNIEGFHWKYKNHQESILTFDNTFSPNILTVNAASATLTGVNVDLVARVTKNDTFRGVVEYNHARYDSYVLEAATLGVVPGVSTTCPTVNNGPTTTIDCSGFQLAHAPDWTASASWEHVFPLNGGADVTAYVGGNYIARRWLASDYAPNEKAGGAVTVDASVTYNAPGGKWNLTAYMRNITNRVVATSATIGLFQPTEAYLSVNAPRTFGGRLSFNF